jgi:beta-glucosidase
MRLLLAAIALAAVAEAQNASLSSVSGASSGASAFTVPSGISGEPLPSTSSQSSGSSLRATASTSAATGSTTDVGGAQSNTGANAVDSEGGIPEGYTSETIPAPLNVTQHFTPKWRKAHRKAREFLKDWTPEEKIKLVTGSGWMVDRCVGNTPPIADRNWKGLCLQDGPLGIRFSYVKASVVKIDLKTEIADDLRDQNSVFPAAINAAATFDKELMYLRGKAMGEEFKGKGVHVALSPMTNMGRVAAGGRNWEGFGGDSYLSGHGTAETIKGLQKAGVQAW